MSRDHHGGCPLAGLDAEELELEWQQIGIALCLFDVGVDAIDVGVDDELAAWVVVRELLAHVFAEHVKPGSDVAVELASSEDLGHRSRRLSAPELELEETIPSGGVTLREEQVALVLGVDMVDAPAIGEDLDVGFQAGDGETLGGRYQRREDNENDGEEPGSFHWIPY